MSRRKSKFSLPKFNFLGIGFVYLLIFIPQIWAVKVGYAGSSIKSRVRGTSKAVFGFTVPIGFVLCPFAWHLEQWCHRMLSPIKLDFYKGDGHTESKWVVAIFFVYPVFISIWWVEYLAAKWVIVNYF
jgi:hypothetical protein